MHLDTAIDFSIALICYCQPLLFLTGSESVVRELVCRMS
jgi:hypothetical protein